MGTVRSGQSEAGIGMTELAVAIVVLGLVLVGLFPLIVDSVRLAAQNADVAQANRVVAEQLDAARTELASVSCPPGTVLEDTAPLPLTPPDSDTFLADRSVTCGADALAEVTVRVQLIANDTATVAEASTQVLTQLPETGTP